MSNINGNMTEPQPALKGSSDNVNTSTLKLTLHSTIDHSQLEHNFICQDNLNSVTVSKIKEYLESEHKIPVSCQTLYFESTLLRDEDTLAQSCIREGDTILVLYSSVADVEDITELMTFLTQCLEQYRNSVALPLQRIKAKKICRIIGNTFSCQRQCEANSLLFIQRGGAEILYELYDLVLKTDNTDLFSNFTDFFSDLDTEDNRFLEFQLACLLQNALIYHSRQIPLLMKHIQENPTLEYTLRSFTRTMIPSQRTQTALSCIQEKFLAPIPIKDALFKKYLEISQLNISSLAEIEEYQLQIASNEEALEQIFSIALTLSFGFSSCMVSVATLNRVSKNMDTHVYLTSPKVINSVFEIKRKQQRRLLYQSPDEFYLDMMVFKASMATFFSELVCHSAAIIPLPLKTKIYRFMKAFLKFADHKEIQLHFYKFGITGVDLVSTVFLPYSPLDPTNCHYTPAHNHTMKKLKKLCVEFGVLHLHYEILDEYQRDLIIDDGLLDYVVCLPWMMDPGSGAQKRACDLVASLSEEMILQPPSLINLARAKLAKTYLGLRKAIKLSVHEIVTQCYKS